MNRKIKLIVTTAIALWCVGIFIFPLTTLWDNLLYVSPFLKFTYGIVCHQEEAKLIYILGLPSLVCARCAGIYLGSFVVSIILLFYRPKLKSANPLYIGSIPMFIDIILYNSGVYPYSVLISFVTGFLFGSVGISYIYDSVENYLLENKRD